VRRSAFIEDSAVDWSDANIVEELNDMLTSLFVKAVVTSEEGYWQMLEYTLLAANQRTYRMPERACAGLAQRFQLSAVSSVDWFPLEEVSEYDAPRYETRSNDYPMRVCVRGESVMLLPPAKLSNQYVMRTVYSLRPSRLCLPQSATTNGLITAVDPVARTLTLSTAVQSVAANGTTSAVSGSVALDVVHPEGWHSVQWTGTGTVSGTTVTLAANASGLAEANDLSMVKVGDYVRAASQTDWPPLPYEFHRTLADAVACKILTLRNMADKANALSQTDVVPALKRFAELLEPRVTSGAFVFVAPEFA
jgi:hypothetical protein